MGINIKNISGNLAFSGFLITLAVFCALTFAEPAHAWGLTLGGRVILQQQSTVDITFISTETAYYDIVYLVSPENRTLFTSRTTPAGTTITVGPYPIGTELIFALVNEPGNTFYSGSWSGNGDGVAHVSATPEGGSWYMNFEDLYGGGDRDYNDMVMKVTPNLIPVCNTNADCGNNAFTGSNFCWGNSVFRLFASYTCNNPGTASSFCSNSTSQQLQQNCSINQFCSNGACQNFASACTVNYDCGTSGLTGGNYCIGNSVYSNFTSYFCNNGGTPSAFCSNSIFPQLQQTCAANQTCSLGSCVNNAPVVCNNNADCGTNGYTGGPFCQGNSVYQNFTTYTCNNPGTQNSFCSNSTAAQLQQTCSNTQTCSNGSCSNNPPPPQENVFARRGPGFWQTHTAFTVSTLNSTPLFIGVNAPVEPSSHKGMLTTPGQVFGAFYSSISMTTTGWRRNTINRTRMILLPHLLTAKLNCAAFGCSLATQVMISNADAAYASGNIFWMHSVVSTLNANNGGGGSIGDVGNTTPTWSQSLADK